MTAYYRVLFGSDYSKKNGRFGIVRCNSPIDEYALKDGQTCPAGLLEGLDLEWEGNPNKVMADFQMMYLPWRLISERAYRILLPVSRPELVEYHPVEVVSDIHGKSPYYIMHFPNTLYVVIKDDAYKTYGTMKARIDTSGLAGEEIFQWREFSPGTFLLSEKVKAAFEPKGMTGASYQSVS